MINNPFKAMTQDAVIWKAARLWKYAEGPDEQASAVSFSTLRIIGNFIQHDGQ